MEAWIVAAATVAAGAYAANQKKNAAEDAANQASQASQLARAQNQYQFEQTQKNLAPFVQGGQQAQNSLAQLLGLGGQAPDYSVLTESPQYQFALQQGQQAVDRNAAARGTLFSGAHTKDAMRFGQGLASQQFQNYFNNLSSLASRGENAATGQGNLGARYAGQNNALLMNAADIRGNVGIYKAGVNSRFANQLLNQANGINWGSLFSGTPAGTGSGTDGNLSGLLNGTSGGQQYNGPEAITAPENISIYQKPF